MFNFEVVEVNNETVSKLVSDDVTYIFYSRCRDLDLSINAYIVHPANGGLIRRDYTPIYKPFLNWGFFTQLYAGAK